MELTEEEKAKLKTKSPLLRLLYNQLRDGMKMILSDDCDYNEEHQEEILEKVSLFVSPNAMLSKYLVAKELNVTERQVDRYIEDGLLCKGIKHAGFKELQWKKSDVNKARKIIKKRGSA